MHRALKGFVIDGSSRSTLGNASIHVLGNSHVVYSTIDSGDYWRLLPTEGHITLWASKFGYVFFCCHASTNSIESALSNGLLEVFLLDEMDPMLQLVIFFA